MMTEQELNNLIREKAQTNIPSIVQEIMRLTQELEQKARAVIACWNVQGWRSSRATLAEALGFRLRTCNATRAHATRRRERYTPPRGPLIPFNSNSPTGSTFASFSTFVSTRGLIRI